MSESTPPDLSPVLGGGAIELGPVAEPLEDRHAHLPERMRYRASPMVLDTIPPFMLGRQLILEINGDTWLRQPGDGTWILVDVEESVHSDDLLHRVEPGDPLAAGPWTPMGRLMPGSSQRFDLMTGIPSTLREQFVTEIDGREESFVAPYPLWYNRITSFLRHHRETCYLWLTLAVTITFFFLLLIYVDGIFHASLR